MNRRPVSFYYIGNRKEGSIMMIRTATMDDLTELSNVESACFPVSEAATAAEFEERIRYYGNHFLLMLRAKR